MNKNVWIIIRNPMEKSCSLWKGWTRAMLTPGLAYKNTSSLYNSWCQETLWYLSVTWLKLLVLLFFCSTDSALIIIIHANHMPSHPSHCLFSPPSTWDAIMTLIAQELTFPLSGYVLHCALRAICVPRLQSIYLFTFPNYKKAGKGTTPIHK